MSVNLTPVDFSKLDTTELRSYWDSMGAVSAELGAPPELHWKLALEAELNARDVMTQDAEGWPCASYDWVTDPDFQDGEATGGHGPAGR